MENILFTFRQNVNCSLFSWPCPKAAVYSYAVERSSYMARNVQLVSSQDRKSHLRSTFVYPNETCFFHLYIQRSFYRMNNPPIRQKQKKLSVWPEFVSSSSALHQPIHFHQHEIRKGQDPGGNRWRIGGQRDYHHLEKREA